MPSAEALSALVRGFPVDWAATVLFVEVLVDDAALQTLVFLERNHFLLSIAIAHGASSQVFRGDGDGFGFYFVGSLRFLDCRCPDLALFSCRFLRKLRLFLLAAQGLVRAEAELLGVVFLLLKLFHFLINVFKFLINDKENIEPSLK